MCIYIFCMYIFVYVYLFIYIYIYICQNIAVEDDMASWILT